MASRMPGGWARLGVVTLGEGASIPVVSRRRMSGGGAGGPAGDEVSSQLCLGDG